MTIQESLSTELRDVVGPFLRTHGFKGSGKTWRLWFDNGDCAIVNVQSSRWNSGTDLRFFVNLGYIVPALVEWRATRRSSPSNAKLPRAEDGIWWTRLDPAGGNQWVASSREGMHSAADELVDLLANKAIPTLLSLRDKKTLLNALVTHSTPGFGYVGHTSWDVPLVLVDDGMSPQLEDALAAFSDDSEFVTWVRARAERIDAERHAAQRQSDERAQSGRVGIPRDTLTP